LMPCCKLVSPYLQSILQQGIKLPQAKRKSGSDATRVNKVSHLPTKDI
jgi:hypothetical protein